MACYSDKSCKSSRLQKISNIYHNSSSFKYPIFGGISASEEICLVLLTHYCPKNEDESCPLSKIKSCISWPTDETLAKVFNFELDFYEQYNRFSNKRFVYLLFELIKNYCNSLHNTHNYYGNERIQYARSYCN